MDDLIIRKEIQRVQNDLKEFSSSSKVWIYYSEKSFQESKTEIQECIDTFIKSWKSHGDKVYAYGTTISNHIILFIVDIEKGDVSGCSTDSSVHFIQNLEAKYGLNFFNRNLVHYIEDDGFHSIPLSDITSLKTKDIQIVNPFFNDLNDWNNKFLQNLNDSMYSRLLS